MNSKSGKDRLRTCLQELDKSLQVDDLILYKYGNRDIRGYQTNVIDSKLISEDYRIIQDKAAVVKCLLKSEIYVAWRVCVGIGNGKYSVSKSEVEQFEKATNCDFKEIITGTKDSDRVYIFRNESGIKKFFTEVLEINEQSE